jgi:pimeloyl-ACP methyl ester carboxylesterase
MVPTTHYAKSGDVHIAYQVVGEGPVDLVLIHGWISHLEYQWEDPALAPFLDRLASFSRLIVFDKRGTGLSDRVAGSALPTLEQRMDDIRAVMDAAGSSRAVIFGISEGGPLSTLFAATYLALTPSGFAPTTIRGPPHVRSIGQRRANDLPQPENLRRPRDAAESVYPWLSLIHVAKGVTVSFDPLHKVWRQFALCRSAIKCPFLWIGQIGKTRPFAHIQAHCRLLRINVKIVFLH